MTHYSWSCVTLHQTQTPREHNHIPTKCRTALPHTVPIHPRNAATAKILTGMAPAYWNSHRGGIGQHAV